jgi:hypothetical protein
MYDSSPWAGVRLVHLSLIEDKPQTYVLLANDSAWVYYSFEGVRSIGVGTASDNTNTSDWWSSRPLGPELEPNMKHKRQKPLTKTEISLWSPLMMLSFERFEIDEAVSLLASKTSELVAEVRIK